MERLNFSLRRQLIIVSLFLLTLPWAGCQFIRELEDALGNAQQQALRATAETVAAMAGERPGLIYVDPERMAATDAPAAPVYATPATQRVVVDGYAEEWEDVAQQAWTSSQQGSDLVVRTQAATQDDRLYLLLKVHDRQVVYDNPGLTRAPNGDRLLLRLWAGGERQDYVLTTAAPGRLQARKIGATAPGSDAAGIWGYWQDALHGYTLELELPLPLTGERLGFLVIDSDAANLAFNERGHASGDESSNFVDHNNALPAARSTAGNISPGQAGAPPWLIRTPPAAAMALSPFRAQTYSIQLLDNAGWVVADLPAPDAAAGKSDTFWLLRFIYRNILADDRLPYPDPAEQPGKLAPAEVDMALGGTATNLRYRDPSSSNRQLRVAAVPVRHGGQVIGAVITRQSSEQYLSLTDKAFSRLLGYSAIAIAVGSLGLLGYATLLSWRIRKLSRSAQAVIAADGSIRGSFPHSSAPDEIGDLSRRYAELLQRLREYNDYLRTLSRKLAHELRTPIAVIETSLENLEETTANPAQAGTYLNRARQGLHRLNSILGAMSEASRLEESLSQNPLVETDLVPLLRELAEAYGAVYHDHPVKVSLPEQGQARVLAAPELVVQLLDKLMDNAASFSPQGEPLILSLDRVEERWHISVSNSGPLLPADVHSTLFEPMVSQRPADDPQLHLGLGLHIARLISEYLDAEISAANTSTPPGVRITVSLPVL
ncbi:hypothetical protein F0M18_07040 [Pseudohalioglobus sediminis]|uniref:histidine kinase n=1 Tax=Pseudohalioglobus sediminis TaxID=2606449 RepID=A0A5B0X285_9GAMM|nr:ATP-binding protein [Pseudohalioglobus sediminis]KAA1192421.1 hypothetical protein F0M18_07040 [Pseudohalioglobus sediminis]